MENVPETQSKEPLPDRRYPFRFSPAMWVVMGLLVALCAAAIALTTWQFVGFLSGDISSVYEWLKYLLLYLVSGLLSVLLVAMLIRSQYVLTENKLLMRFGFICQSYELKKIFSVHLFRGSGKLAVYFDDFKTKYTVIVVKSEWYDDFVKELLARNERIAFTFSTAEEEAEFKRKK